METKVEKNQLYQQLATCKLLPLYTATDLRYLPQVESVLVENELPFIEVTFRSQLALPAIKQLAASGNLIVGAGTVRTLKEAQEAVANGAQFIVSPAIVPEVIDFCLANEVPIFPGTATPGEIQRALAYGLRVVKFFPADIYGGPFYDVQFLPTGGIDETNFIEYVEAKEVLAVGGSFILSEKMLQEDEASARQHVQSLLTKIKERQAK